jgi:hypothetical protein
MLDQLFPLLITLVLGPFWMNGWSCSARVQVPGEYLAQAAASCPVGDHVHVSVHDFIVREMEQQQVELSREQARILIEQDAQTARTPDLKSMWANLVETSFSHVLSDLCRANPACVSIAIYGRAGVAIGLSSIASVSEPYGVINDGRWATMSRQDHQYDGLVEPLSCADAVAAGLLCTTNYVSVAYPVYEEHRFLGVAHCIMDISQIHRQSKL